MGGELISYGDALKAFRRGVHQFPSVWKAVVVCNTGKQADYAMQEAVSILDGGSLELRNINYPGRQITTAKGGEVRFVVTDTGFYDRIRGLEIPQVIVVCGVSDETRDHLIARNRSPYVDAKYLRYDDVTL
jgi:hypothetical protein